MATFAELTTQNIVARIVVINNAEMIADGIESESNGVDFLASIYGHRRWKQSDVAAIGMWYNAETDQFNLPQVPDWRSFQTAITVAPAFMRIAGHNGQTLTILPTLVYVCSLIESDATRAVQFAGLWNAIATIAEPTIEEITALNAIASANNVPFQLNAEGLIQ